MSLIQSNILRRGASLKVFPNISRLVLFSQLISSGFFFSFPVCVSLTSFVADIVQMGTVIEPMSEFFSSRLSKKERKATLADELLSDQTLKQYR